MPSERRKIESTVLVEEAEATNYGQDGIMVKLHDSLCISYNNGPPMTTHVVLYPEGKLSSFMPNGRLYHLYA